MLEIILSILGVILGVAFFGSLIYFVVIQPFQALGRDRGHYNQDCQDHADRMMGEHSEGDWFEEEE
ncbi:MAG TPA: hypothetical protein VMM38_01395 [Aridibacter sp.]|nr:hypothetical protein [Aridibacter sp.]